MLIQWLTRSIHVFSLQVRKRWEDLMVESQKKNWLGGPWRKCDLREARHGIAKLIMGPHTTNPIQEYSCLQQGSNPSSHQSGGCGATPYTAWSLQSLPTLRIAYMSWDFLTCWRVCGNNLNIISMCAVSPVVHTSNSSSRQKNVFSFPVAVNNSIKVGPLFFWL